MFRKIISQALLLVLLGWALPPSVLRADSAMGHAMGNTQPAESLRLTNKHACCPHHRAQPVPTPANLAVPYRNEHRCCFLQGPAVPAAVTVQSSGIDGLPISTNAATTILNPLGNLAVREACDSTLQRPADFSMVLRN